MKITHNAAASRFEYTQEGAVAICEYRRIGGVWDLCHTYVPDSMRGQGVAGELARATLNHVREVGGLVRPSCSYIRAFIERNPEYAPLLENGAPRS
jgi:uncharacterized protein